MAGAQFLAGARDFSLFYSVETSSGVHLASYPVGMEGSFHRDKAAGVKLTTYLYLVLRSRMVNLNLSSPICLHGVVLSYLIRI
jgi:hypothetical protein